MQIICRKKIQIVEYEYVKNSKTEEMVALAKRSITISPSVEPQLAPDWIKNEEHFRLLVDDGTIREVVVISEKKTATEIPTVAATGWGASAAGLAIGAK